MKQLICPNCQKVFKVDQDQYSSLLAQIKNNEFKKELSTQLQIKENEYQQKIIDKDNKIKLLEANLNASHQEQLFKLKKEIQDLKTIINNNDLIKQNEITQEKLKQQQTIQQLEATINNLKLENIKQDELHKLQIKAKDDEIQQIQDYKAKTSIKLIGEDLEQHCYNQFMKLKQDGLISSHCVLEKDNDAIMGTKGDFIYREYDHNQNEILSIMFEMKNEQDSSKNKQTNESHLAKLDQDRQQKKCEYAILVSMLELDNPRFDGIADMSYIYPKTYVIRPQFFIPIIGILRNANQNAIKYKQELIKVKQEEIDVTNFEEKLFQFQNEFNKKVLSASNKFQTAIADIDKSIKALEKVKQNLLSSQKLLEQANNNATKLSIRKLTHNNKTMSQKFKNINKD